MSAPARPKEPFWPLLACGIGVALVFKNPLASSPFVIVGAYGLTRYYRALAAYEKAHLDWQISNARAWVLGHEEQLAERQPWFDDDEDWEFQQRHALENWKSKLAELEAKREGLG